ncbi:hypothetical protein [Ligilactobacillus ruminis]|uniref:hypothetical protein n=1 Tax=Ligilactobacillus ruminis TaxID=1623 RepID=UPI000A8DEEAB
MILSSRASERVLESLSRSFVHRLFIVENGLGPLDEIIDVYGHIDENGSSVRKRLARKMAITDNTGKNSRLSVNLIEILDKSVEHHCI